MNVSSRRVSSSPITAAHEAFDKMADNTERIAESIKDILPDMYQKMMGQVIALRKLATPYCLVVTYKCALVRDTKSKAVKRDSDVIHTDGSLTLHRAEYTIQIKPEDVISWEIERF